MNQKNKKVILWIVLIWFAILFVDSFIKIFLGIERLVLTKVLPSDCLISLSLLALSAYIVIKLQKKLGVRNLFKRNEPKN